MTRSDALERAGVGAYFRPQDVEPLGLSPYDLLRMAADGQVERVGRGLYRRAGAPVTDDDSVALVAAAVPQGIVCLMSALQMHDLGTQSPHEVWLALDRKARPPRVLPVKVRIVRYSGRMLTEGVTSRTVQGVSVRITDPARTVVDCFRYRNKFGVDVALEALRDVLRTKKASVAQLERVAEVCRIRTVMRPYVEALLA
jgi:predicted transcriptional regulator of viral defense system